MRKKQQCFRLTIETEARLKAKANQQGRSLSNLVEIFVENELKKLDREESLRETAHTAEKQNATNNN